MIRTENRAIPNFSESQSGCSRKRALGVATLLLALVPALASSAPAWKEVYDPMVVRTLHLAVDPADWTRVINDQPAEGETLSQERASAWFSDQPIGSAFIADTAPPEGSLLVEIRRKGATDPVLTRAA